MILKRGAEAEIRTAEFLGRSAVAKVRLPKAYRLPALDDNLRKTRMRTEARLMAEARAAGVAVPVLYDIDLQGHTITMEFVEGPTLKDALEAGGPQAAVLAREMGHVAGRLHRAGIIHGDLTTSNMVVRDGGIVMLDFSLGGKARDPESRGVDLHLLREALTSTHARARAYYREVLAGYREVLGAEADAVLAKVKEIESRGRYT